MNRVVLELESANGVSCGNAVWLTLSVDAGEVETLGKGSEGIELSRQTLDKDVASWLD